MSDDVIGFKFSMPCNEVIEIRSSEPIPEEIELDEQYDNAFYTIWWGDISLPWCTRTKQEAISMALGAQWAAKKMYEKMKSY